MEIVFPTSTAPSRNPTENGGRLINCYAEKAPDGARNRVIYRPVPGMDLAFTAGSFAPRGALLVGTVLYIVNGDKAYSVTKAGEVYSVTELAGDVGGEGRVDMAHNMRSPANQVLITHSAGIDEIDTSAVSPFSDGDLPASNSLAFQDGYFFHTTAAGQCYASDLNDTNVNENSYITAESSPDGLLRAIPIRRDLMLMGTVSAEFWSNAGNETGFPYSRGPVIPFGLWSRQAVAGYEFGFPGPLMWVANDGTVRQLSGYSAEKVSTPHIERMIQSIADRSTLRASVFISAGHPCWVLKSDEWTLVYDLSTGEWHERATHRSETWFAEFGIFAFNEWLVFDGDSGAVYRVNDMARREAGQPIVMDLRSTQQHSFPARTAIDRASFDFVVGVGIDRGISPIQTTPKVSISWSDNGGRTFGNDLLRDLGTQGEVVPIDLYRLGLTGRTGRQWRLRISDPVEVAFLGGSMFGEGRAA